MTSDEPTAEEKKADIGKVSLITTAQTQYFLGGFTKCGGLCFSWRLSAVSFRQSHEEAGQSGIKLPITFVHW